MLDLNKLRQLHAASTPGEWESVLGYCGARQQRFLRRDSISDGLLIGHDADCNFIAAAHNAMPALLDELEAARELSTHLRKAYDDQCEATAEHERTIGRLRKRIAELEALNAAVIERSE